MLAAIVVVDASIFVWTMQRRVTRSGVYDEAVAFAQVSPQAKSVLGDDIRPTFPALGYASGETAAQFNVFSVGLKGSRGSGRMYVAANSLNGKWDVSGVSLVTGAHKTDLLPSPPLLSLPPVPKHKVYLIPAGLDARDSVAWAPDYYRAKMGIDVEVLPAIAMPEELVNQTRRQVDSERFVQYVRNTYREIAGDPSNILIGVTSRDIFIRSYSWRYAINWRQDGRFAITSSARVRPRPLFDRWNPEWAGSRFRKMLTKNIALLCFDLPMSADKTSMLYGGILAGNEIDAMGGSIVGADGEWEAFEASGGAADVTIYDVPGKLPVWRISESGETLPQTSAHVFVANLSAGLFMLRKTDFFFEGQFPLQFIRAYRSQDEQSRPFGVGANDSLDIFLTGEMGKYVDLQLETAGRVHFKHLPPGSGQKVDTYIGSALAGSPFSEARAYFDGKMWTVERSDGWKFYFPYRREAPGANVTVLTSFRDPGGHTYEMTRNDTGDLLSITTPSGQWLHFKRTPQRTVEEISSSDGRRGAVWIRRAGGWRDA